MTLSMLLNHERASRLIVLKSRNNNQLGLDYMIKQLVNNTILKTNTSLNGLELEIQKLVNYRVLNHMFLLANNKQTHEQVNAILYSNIFILKLSFDNLIRFIISNIYPIYNFFITIFYC